MGEGAGGSLSRGALSRGRSLLTPYPMNRHTGIKNVTFPQFCFREVMIHSEPDTSSHTYFHVSGLLHSENRQALPYVRNLGSGISQPCVTFQ